MGCKYDGNDYNWHEGRKTLARFQGCTVDEEGKIVKEDVVNHPSHYTDGKIEVIDFIEDKKLSYHLGNAVKYISRAGKKDPDKYVQDLLKAIWYLQREVDRNGK